MLASPLQYQAPPNLDKPAKDIESFKQLLPPPVEFVEGSSSGAFVIPDSIKPVNGSPIVEPPATPTRSRRSLSPPVNRAERTRNPNGQSPVPSATRPESPTKDLFPKVIDTSWPKTSKHSFGRGILNDGNTCYINATIQSLLHTPALLRLVHDHDKKGESCALKASNVFCMICALRHMAINSFGFESNHNRPMKANEVLFNLNAIAKHLRKGRQEDSHEFLRYAIDAIQKSCLACANQPPKVDPKVAHTTWIHKLFGGQLRSRVHCNSCGFNSDTFDHILDLSLDIHACSNIDRALKKFVAPDHLGGSDKYKCEKCQKHVNAEKRFTVHKAPLALTVHLKRFSPYGRKLAHLVDYGENLSLGPYMSEDESGPSYQLYGVICHAGTGPNSGHYYAFVKGKDCRWYQMNDDEVNPVSANSVMGKKTAYMLFYLRKESLIQSTNGMASDARKRKERDRDEPESPPVKKPFIGPVIPPDLIAERKDPQAVTMQKKIENFKAAQVNKTTSLVPAYNSDEDGPPKTQAIAKESSASTLSDHHLPPPSSSPVSSPAHNSSPAPSVTADSFYSFGNKATPSQKIHTLNSKSNQRAKNGFTPYSFGSRRPRPI